MVYDLTKKSMPSGYQNYSNASDTQLEIPYWQGELSEIKICDFDKINEYHLSRYFSYIPDYSSLTECDNSSKTLMVSDANIDLAMQLQAAGRRVSLIKDADFDKTLEMGFAAENTAKARYLVDFIAPLSCAKNVSYAKILIIFLILNAILFWFSSSFFVLLNNLLYLTHNIFKLVLFFKNENSRFQKRLQELPEDHQLPVYTVLVPLYQEIHKLESIVNAMQDLDYPKDKLDVKLIIEKDDDITIKGLTLMKIPEFIQVIKVPYSEPRTKPKALNYAASFARGEFLTIYDAEDKPEPLQLKKAVQAFRTLPAEFACLQARLNFYNSNENQLARFFSIEYGIWFNYLLKGLNCFNMSIPLGGTSNHFKISVLKEIGFWDAYNVTEDADLGIRLSMRGYRVHLLDSLTLEECPISLGNWFHQRARWIKGYIQTSLVYWANKSDRKKLDINKKFSIMVFVCLIPYSFFSVPWIFASTYLDINSYVMNLVLINYAFSIFYMYTTSIVYLLHSIGGIKNISIYDIWIILIWPSYFLLLSAASYIALWQCITNPFKWNKTFHGESNNSQDIIT